MDIDKLEEYFESVENYFFASVSAVTSNFPDVHDAVNRIWVDISRYGPALPSVYLPSLGDFQVPPPPPPPPPKPTSWLDNSCIWFSDHPWKAAGLVVGATGTCILLAGYARAYMYKSRIQRARAQTNERRQVIVLLGGDTTFALPLILDLERKGYIVIASVSNPEACTTLENQCQGYVRALVLDPSEPATINAFLRSLTSTLSIRFPINSAGDPFVSSSSQPYIHGVISLLTLSPQISVTPAPLEHVSLANTYLPFLTATQITPLRAIQSLLPLLRTSPRDKGNKSIVICVPATEARVGIPFASVQSMTVAGTLRGVEVLKREIRLASVTDTSGLMKNIEVVTVEVGALKYDDAPYMSADDGEDGYSIRDLSTAMEEWTATEKASYGPAFTAIARDYASPRSRWQALTSLFENGNHFGVPRQAVDVSLFVDRIVTVISDGEFGSSLGFVWHRVQKFVCGERFSVGAGATTYKIASHLPYVILDGLLNLPAVLISIRNRLLPVQVQPSPPRNVTAPEAKRPAMASERDVSETEETNETSEWEAESNASEAAEGSWITLHPAQEGGNP
ncbi:hypothetical protein APHAL10511_001088 [Amanita phalloides]|nr:hypothetical protein APHAL10511_001088 [Amanita phalloides]